MSALDNQNFYLCIDLKSFYASVECVERGLDPMITNLVVADPERSTGTLCLAVSSSMKALGVKNRCRVYEIPKGIDYIMASPRMQKYIDYAAKIYSVYLEYIAPDDIHVYSIDECFIDVTNYLRLYKKTPEEMGKFLMDEVFKNVGVRATCGVGTNLYLAKIALDISAKHSPDFIGYLDEEMYRTLLWKHEPLTDFWRIGEGTANKLRSVGIYNMGDLAIANEDMLYRRFGIDAELLIDHAWGRESTTMADIKTYKPSSNSISNGQVLLRDYNCEEARLIVKEMLDILCLDMVEKNIVAESVTMWVGYSKDHCVHPAHGTVKLPQETNSDKIIIPAVLRLYDQEVDGFTPIRRINISCNKVSQDMGYQQLTFDEKTDIKIQKNHSIQQALLGIKKKYGKNAILRGINFLEASTMCERNEQIGGHKRGA